MGFPLWLGSTGEGFDSIQVSGCQTRAWRSTFYTRASLVHMVLRVLILYWFPFYARLEARLGVQSLYYAKIHPKIKPLFLFFHCEAWGSWFYTDVYIYRILQNYIYNILIYFILIFWTFLESYGFFWNLLDCYSKKIIEKRKKKQHKKHFKTNTDRVLYTIRVLCKTLWSGNHLVILGIII